MHRNAFFTANMFREISQRVNLSRMNATHKYKKTPLTPFLPSSFPLLWMRPKWYPFSNTVHYFWLGPRWLYKGDNVPFGMQFLFYFGYTAVLYTVCVWSSTPSTYTICLLYMWLLLLGFRANLIPGWPDIRLVSSTLEKLFHTMEN